MKFAVIYMKIKTTKGGDISFEGPLVGARFDTREEAEEQAREIVANSRMAVIPKIYPVDENQETVEILESASEHFDRMMKNILESKEITDRPIRRSKKRRALKK